MGNCKKVKKKQNFARERKLESEMLAGPAGRPQTDATTPGERGRPGRIRRRLADGIFRREFFFYFLPLFTFIDLD
jgi:hypothetical protein